MSKEKRMLGNYEITQSIYIGDKEVVFGVDGEEQACKEQRAGTLIGGADYERRTIPYRT